MCTALMRILNKVINIPYSENLLFARKAIAEAFDFGINDFTIFVNMKPLGPEENDTHIRDIGFNVIYVIEYFYTKKTIKR